MAKQNPSSLVIPPWAAPRPVAGTAATGGAAAPDHDGWPRRPAPDGARAAAASTATDWRRHTARPVPSSGWRRAVYRGSAGTINPGESPADARDRQLDRTICAPIDDSFIVGVMQLKGGSGKTTTTMGLGNAFAEVRSKDVIAVDVDPERGNLARRTVIRTDSSATSLLTGPRPQRLQDIRVHTQQTLAGLDILASAQDPAVAEAFSADEYDRVVDILHDWFALILSDCGTGITHAATQAVLQKTDAVVIPMDAKTDSADEAVATVEYLHSVYDHLLPRTIVVISPQRPGRHTFDVGAATSWFAQRVHAVHQIPYDQHLDEGGEIDPRLMERRTRTAYRELAAAVAGLFPVNSPTSGLLRIAG